MKHYTDKPGSRYDYGFGLSRSGILPGARL